MKKFYQKVGDKLDYVVDWSQWLDADEIILSEWDLLTTLETADTFSIVSIANTTLTATVWVELGTQGLSYDLKNSIVTAGGRETSETIRIRVT